MLSTRSAAAILTSTVTAFTIAACGTHSAPTQENFKAAVQAYLDKQPAVCVQSPSADIPFDAPKSTHRGVDDFDRAQAMSSAGLLEASPGKVAFRGDKSLMVEGAHYVITETGNKFLVPAGKVSIYPSFCGGKADLKELAVITPPTGTNVGSLAIVRFGYVVTDAPAWARNDEMQKAFSQNLRAMSQTTYQQMSIALTKDGWTAAY
ncbi:hypothetical protein [Caballeronia sp. DA-9]|uniref:hypothetical protein n=1 Tax=Caballeronia sp. DA-9 TaxID=3436237 RepID=UPI003F67E11B